METGHPGIARLLLNKAHHLIEEHDILSLAENGISQILDALKKIPTENGLNTLEQAFLKNENQTIRKLFEKGLSADINAQPLIGFPFEHTRRKNHTPDTAR